MNKESEKALQSLTGKTDFTEVSPEEMQQLADAHPYFAGAQLLLTQKMKQMGAGSLPEQLQKTALYFPNEQWLCYLLSETKEKATKSFETAVKPATEQKVVAEQDASKTATKPTEEISSGFIIPADSKEVIADELFRSDEYEPIAVKEESKTAEAIKSPTDTEDNNLITLPAEHILEDIPALGNNVTDEPEEAPLDEEELREQSGELPLPATSQKISSLLSGQIDKFHKPVAEDATLPIPAPEPLHTIDYFASQGIKLDPKREDNAFDKKVHKFTDWLRQMKRINPQPVDLGTETEEERFVANIADSSNHTKKVLTESMAEVLVKQGKRDKAIEIYQKLSLLNPDKSVYFAALIQNIK